MPETLLHLQQSLHSRVNDLRSLQRMAALPDFEEAYRSASVEQQRVLLNYIREGDRDGVQRWLAIQERDQIVIEELPVKELRRLAASLGIAGYQLMSKASLLSQIRNKEST